MFGCTWTKVAVNCISSIVLNVKELVGVFNQEKTLVGAFFMLVGQFVIIPCILSEQSVRGAAGRGRHQDRGVGGAADLRPPLLPHHHPHHHLQPHPQRRDQEPPGHHRPPQHDRHLRQRQPRHLPAPGL